MPKVHLSPEDLLQLLGELSSYLTSVNDAEIDCFEKPLDIMRKALGFDMSVLYKIANVVENDLLLEVSRDFDPLKGRLDLAEGSKMSIDFEKPDEKFINEAKASIFSNRNLHKSEAAIFFNF